MESDRTGHRAPIIDADWLTRHLADVVVCEVGAGSTGGSTRDDHRSGHIPGARFISVDDDLAVHLANGGVVVDSRAAERYRGETELIDAVAQDPEAIVYCGSGVTACHNALAVERAGLPLPRVYVGSWSGWSSDPTRPVAVRDEG